MTAKKRKELVPVEGMRVTDGLIDAVVQIGQERAKILEAMKEALVCGDEHEALERARGLTGVPSNRSSRKSETKSVKKVQ
jgi:hypothetical protein